LPKTYVVNVRVSVEDVATIVAFLRQNGDTAITKSHPVVRGMEIGAEVIRQNYPEFTFHFQEAMDFISTMGYDPMPGRSVRPMVSALQDIELSAVPSPAQPSSQPSKECIQSTEEDFDVAQRRKREEEELSKVFANLNDANIDMAE